MSVSWRSHGRVTTLAGCLCALAFLAACGSGSDDSGSGEDFKVGLSLGVSGDFAPWAKRGIESSEIAADEVNDAGGVNGGTLKLIVADNKTSAEGGVSTFRKLTEVDGVVAVAGLDSDPATAVFDAGHEQEIPMMCPICGTSRFDTTGGEYLFRMTASDSDAGVASAQFAAEDGVSSVSLLVERTESTQSTADIFKASFEAHVGEVIDDVRFDPGERNFAALVQQAFDGDPEAVYLGTSFESAIPIFNEWRSRGYGGKFYVTPDVLVSETALDFLGGGVATGAVTAYDVGRPAYQSFAERYEARTGDQPSAAYGEPNYYDEVILLALAATAAGESSGSAIAEHMAEVAGPPGTPCDTYAACVELLDDGEEVDFEGAGGPLDFNEHGNLDAPVIVAVEPKRGDWRPTGEPIQIDPAFRP